jgi:tRNA modification GTPase
VTETLAVRLTPPGTGAIATIALRGPSAWQIARALFCPRSEDGRELPERPEYGQVWLGRFGAELADEVILAVKPSDPVPWLEVHCHGGNEVVALLLEALVQQGARACDYPEFRASFLPRDPWRDLAQERLFQAPTARTAALLLWQCDCGFTSTLESILSSLEKYPDVAEMMLRALAGAAPLGRHLIEPWHVTVAGAPNVGKSSLVNALAGYQRSVVSPTPGTTRDVVTTTIALDGWPVELADTAGLRQEAGPLEGQGIERARGAVATADLCVWVLDASAAPVWPDVPPERVLLVINKTDLPATWDLGSAAGAVRVSALTGAGIPELCEAIVRRLVPEAPGPDTVMPFTPELCDGIEEAYAHLVAGRCDEVRRVLGALLTQAW